MTRHGHCSTCGDYSTLTLRGRHEHRVHIAQTFGSEKSMAGTTIWRHPMSMDCREAEADLDEALRALTDIRTLVADDPSAPAAIIRATVDALVSVSSNSHDEAK